MVQRLLIFFIGSPILAAIVLLLPQYNHLAINILIVLFSALGAAELSIMLAQKKINIGKAESAVLGSLAPLAMLLTVSFQFNSLLLPAIIAVAVSWLLLSNIISRGDKLNASISRMTAGLSVLLYPGILMTWIVRMSSLEENAGIVIMTFLCVVFGGDSAAWAFGILFGKGNRGVIPVSPNKSVAGFIAGFTVPVVIGLGAALLLPRVFVPEQWIIAPVAGSAMGLLTGITGALGDLGESAIKRSSGLKDSGSIIPGRGGVLDSIDSVALAAPVFYLAFRLFFAQP